jgi:hypothetical protein
MLTIAARTNNIRLLKALPPQAWLTCTLHQPPLANGRATVHKGYGSIRR